MIGLGVVAHVAKMGFMRDGVSTITIPGDLRSCQSLVQEQAYLNATLAQSIAELQEKNHTLEQDKQELKLTITELLQRAFARRSERYLHDPNQLRLDFNESDEAAEAAEGLAEAVEESGQGVQVVKEHTRTKKKKPRTEKLPEHLPRYEVEAEVPEDLKNCPQHGERKVIGYDTVETLEFERPKLKVRVTKYPKLACPSTPGCGITSPERPTGLVEGNRYDTSLAAEIITNKYGYHLPVYRQQDQFASSGWTPSRSTLLNLLTSAHFALRPLVEHIQSSVLADDILGTDDTTLTLLLPPEKNIPKPLAGDVRSERTYAKLCDAVAQGKPSLTARMWAYRAVNIPLTFFDFTVSRERAGPDLVLKSFSGKLMADCYSVYPGIEVRTEGAIERGACVTHARRKVFEARSAYPLEASEVLAKFQQIYDLETRGKPMSAEERFQLRQQEAKPIWQSLGSWLDSPSARGILPKSKLGEALGYVHNHWEPLQLYLTDGRMPIDNNDVEQLMKQVALGRKNWLFTGSVAAGERTADFFTLVTSAVRNDLDVWVYLKDVLDRILAGETDYHPLRPDIWCKDHPEAIRQYRVQERRYKAEQKQTRRAARKARERAANA